MMRVSRTIIDGKIMTNLFVNPEELAWIHEKAPDPEHRYSFERVLEGYIIIPRHTLPEEDQRGGRFYQINKNQNNYQPLYRLGQGARLSRKEHKEFRTPLYNATEGILGLTPEGKVLVKVDFANLPAYRPSNPRKGSLTEETRKKIAEGVRAHRAKVQAQDPVPQSLSSAAAQPAVRQAVSEQLSLAALVDAINNLKEEMGGDLELRIDPDGYLDALTLQRIGRKR